MLDGIYSQLELRKSAVTTMTSISGLGSGLSIASVCAKTGVLSAAAMANASGARAKNKLGDTVENGD